MEASSYCACVRHAKPRNQNMGLCVGVSLPYAATQMPSVISRSSLTHTPAQTCIDVCAPSTVLCLYPPQASQSGLTQLFAATQAAAFATAQSQGQVNSFATAVGQAISLGGSSVAQAYGYAFAQVVGSCQADASKGTAHLCRPCSLSALPTSRAPRTLVPRPARLAPQRTFPNPETLTTCAYTTLRPRRGHLRATMTPSQYGAYPLLPCVNASYPRRPRPAAARRPAWRRPRPWRCARGEAPRPPSHRPVLQRSTWTQGWVPHVHAYSCLSLRPTSIPLPTVTTQSAATSDLRTVSCPTCCPYMNLAQPWLWHLCTPFVTVLNRILTCTAVSRMQQHMLHGIRRLRTSCGHVRFRRVLWQR